MIKKKKTCNYISFLTDVIAMATQTPVELATPTHVIVQEIQKVHTAKIVQTNIIDRQKSLGAREDVSVMNRDPAELVIRFENQKFYSIL